MQVRDFLRRAPAKSDPLPLTLDVFVQVMACLTKAHTKALPLKDGEAFLSDYANALHALARKSDDPDVRAAADSLAATLMAMGH